MPAETAEPGTEPSRNPGWTGTLPAADWHVLSSGYGVGHTAFRVAGAGGRIQMQNAYEGKEMESHHGGFVVVGNHVYGPNQNSLVCMELKTGKVAWQDRSVGKGSITYADGHLIIRD